MSDAQTQIEFLRQAILAGFDKVPQRFKLPEGDGHVLHLGLNPRDLSKLSCATAPCMLLCCQITAFLAKIAPGHKYSSIVIRDCAGRDIHKDLRNSHYPQGITRLSDFQGGQLWIESPSGNCLKTYMGVQVAGTVCEVPVDRLLLFSGKRYLHCTEPWSGRRVVLVAYTVMGSISIPPGLEEKLQALGIPTPDSLSTEYYFHNPVGPGQPEQTRLPFLPEKKNKVWKAGQLNHEWIGCLNVDSLESENHDIDISEVSNTIQDSVFSIHGSESQDS